MAKIEVIVSPLESDLPFELSKRFAAWLQLVTDLDTLSGTGSPEGVVAAKQKRYYMDETGSTGNILYIKRDADIGGDRKLGWILV